MGRATDIRESRAPPLSSAPLAASLELKPGMKGSVIALPEGFKPNLGLPDEFISTETKALDFVVAFCRDAEAVRTHGPTAAKMIRADGVLWLCYPEHGGLDTDLDRDRGWDDILAMGFDAARQVAIDGTWSALRFRRGPA